MSTENLNIVPGTKEDFDNQEQRLLAELSSIEKTLNDSVGQQSIRNWGDEMKNVQEQLQEVRSKREQLKAQ